MKLGSLNVNFDNESETVSIYSVILKNINFYFMIYLYMCLCIYAYIQ